MRTDDNKHIKEIDFIFIEKSRYVLVFRNGNQISQTKQSEDCKKLKSGIILALNN